jgi:hypothetical protein
MKRIPYIAGTIALLAAFGCAPKTDQPAEDKKAPEAKEAAAPTSSDTLPLSYMDAATALSIDDFDKAKVSLTKLSKETTGDLQAKATTAANAADLPAMREAFKELSAVAVNFKLPPEYAVAFCPMFKGGSKWVQKKDKLANPYFGKSMQTCGSFVN